MSHVTVFQYICRCWSIFPKTRAEWFTAILQISSHCSSGDCHQNKYVWQQQRYPYSYTCTVSRCPRNIYIPKCRRSSRSINRGINRLSTWTTRWKVVDTVKLCTDLWIKIPNTSKSVIIASSAVYGYNSCTNVGNMQYKYALRITTRNDACAGMCQNNYAPHPLMYISEHRRSRRNIRGG